MFSTYHMHIVSVQSFHSISPMLDQLFLTPIHAPVFYILIGNTVKTYQSVDLGCYFTVHTAITNNSLFRK
jgi:hypothetical protein